MPIPIRLGRQCFRTALPFLVLLFQAHPAGAETAVLTTVFGVLKKADGVTAVPDGALWIMVYDQNDDGVFPGGLVTNGSLTDSEAARDAFGGRTLAKGDLIEGDRIIHLDAVDSTDLPPGMTENEGISLDLTADNLISGRKWAFYWFPGLTTSSTTVPPGDFEVGGINEVTEIQPISDGPMTIPSAVTTIAVYDTSLGGTLPPARFHAITADPFDYAAWIDGYFPGESDQAKIGFDADPDHDGLTNGVEAVLASAPDVPNSGLEKKSVGPETLVVTSHRSKDVPSDISPVWQWSTDLATWHLSGDSEGPLTVAISHLVTNSSHPDYDVVETTVTGSGGPVPILFCRLLAEQSL